MATKDSRDEFLKKASMCICQQLTHVRASVICHEEIHKNKKFPDIMTNTLILSFALHVRNLNDFFYSDKKKRSDDLLASDFFEPPMVWYAIAPKKSEILRDSVSKFNKHLAHLTKKRVGQSIGDTIWDFQAILEEIEPVVGVFVANIAESYAVIINEEFSCDFWVNIRKVRIKKQKLNLI